MPTSPRITAGRAHSAAQELLQVVMLVMRALAAEMRRGPTPVAPAQFGLLVRMAEAPCSMSELARHQQVSLPTVSKSIDMLARRGWVERWDSPHDRRQTMVRLTRGGRRVLAGIKRRADDHVARRLAQLTAAERARLRVALGALTRVLETSNDTGCA
jgi:DNA-binding MarR family transcriptional regulator